MSDGKQLVAGDGETSMGGTTSLNTIKVEIPKAVPPAINK